MEVGVKIQAETINMIGSADDIAAVAESELDLKSMTEKTEQVVGNERNIKLKLK